MPRLVYKNRWFDIERLPDESDKDFHIRKWFILRSLPDDYFKTWKDPQKMTQALVTSTALSKVHVKSTRHNCMYDDNVMKKLDSYSKHLYIY